MMHETGTHTRVAPRSLAAVIIFALLHLAVGVGIFLAARESLPLLRKDVQYVIAGLAGIIGAGFLRTWTSDTPEETFIAALLTALLAFVAYISVHLCIDASNFRQPGKMIVYAILSLISAGFGLLSLYHLLLGGHRK